MKKLLTLSVLLLVGLNSCKEEDPMHYKTIHVYGYVTNSMTGDTIKDAQVTLRKAYNSYYSNVLWDFPHKLDSVYVDSNGFYEFTFEALKNKSYAVEVESLHYSWDNTMYVPSFEWSDQWYDREIQKDVVIRPLCYLRVRIVNVQPASSSDSLYYDGAYDYAHRFSHIDSAYSHDFALIGSAIDTTFLTTLNAEYGGYHFWNVYQNGVLISENGGYMNCFPIDTCDVTINY